MTKKKRTLDWKSGHDPRSWAYPLRAILPTEVPREAVYWREGVVLDQGSEGACVGYGWAGELLAEPFVPEVEPLVATAESYATLSYRRAQKIDPWPGEDYEGTSVLAGAKIMQADGQIDSYRWCFGVEDIRDAVIMNGPVVVGIPWYSSMYSTDAEGLVEIKGRKVGGHCVVVTGYDPHYFIEGRVQEVFRWRNSWGVGYGLGGSGYVKFDDLARLVADRGEACVPVGRNTPRFDI